MRKLLNELLGANPIALVLLGLILVATGVAIVIGGQ